MSTEDKIYCIGRIANAVTLFGLTALHFVTSARIDNIENKLRTAECVRSEGDRGMSNDGYFVRPHEALVAGRGLNVKTNDVERTVPFIGDDDDEVSDVSDPARGHDGLWASRIVYSFRAGEYTYSGRDQH